MYIVDIMFINKFWTYCNILLFIVLCNKLERLPEIKLHRLNKMEDNSNMKSLSCLVLSIHSTPNGDR
jgi:hypothetical protein